MTQPNLTPFNHESTDTENLENHMGNALGYQEIFRDHAAQIASRTWRSFNFNLGAFDEREIKVRQAFGTGCNRQCQEFCVSEVTVKFHGILKLNP